MSIQTAALLSPRARHALLLTVTFFCLGATNPESTMIQSEAPQAIGLEPRTWVPVNDTVMGGRSQSALREDDRGRLLWTGVLSLENNGGFVSIRSPGGWSDWTDYDGVEVILEGAGRTIQVSLQRADGVVRAGGYRATLPSNSEGETSVFIPFSAFELRQFGRRVSGPMLRPGLARVGQRGLLIADKKEGPFRVTVSAFRPARHSADTRVAPEVEERLVEAVRRGVPQFNAGDHAACRRTYQEALEKSVEEGGVGRRSWSFRVVQDALLRSRSQDSTEAAWTLRGAIDDVLRGAQD